MFLQRQADIPADSDHVAAAVPVLLCGRSAGGAEANQAHRGRHHQGSLEGQRTAVPQPVAALLP